MLIGKCNEGKDSELYGHDGGLVVIVILEICISGEIPDDFDGHTCWGTMAEG